MSTTTTVTTTPVTNTPVATATPTTDKSARLSCRIRPVVKEQAEAAARLLGQSMTDFAETALEEKAKTVLADNERIVLSEHAFSEFLAAISGEPESPSPQLLAAVNAYKRHEPFGSSVPAAPPSTAEQGHLVEQGTK